MKIAVQEKAGSCWEYWGCSEEIRNGCKSYVSDSGHECWFVTGSLTYQYNRCVRLKNEYKKCWDCPWFKMNNPGF